MTSESSKSGKHPTTALIRAHRALNRRCGKESVDWAQGQLLAGMDTALLRQLAGMTPPYNHFELSALRDRVLSECGLTELSRPDGLQLLAAEMLRPGLEAGSDISAAVHEVRALCIEEGHAAELMDFYLLACAHDDLKDTSDQNYWRGATSANILALMRERSLGLIGSVPRNA